MTDIQEHDASSIPVQTLNFPSFIVATSRELKIAENIDVCIEGGEIGEKNRVRSFFMHDIDRL